MNNSYARAGARYRNQLAQSCGALIGIAEGLLADKLLNDLEIGFLHKWLKGNDVINTIWPGDVIFARVKEILDDGVISEDERAHLLETLRQLVGGRLDAIAETPRVNELCIDAVEEITFEGQLFCLTGDFVFAPRARCCEAILARHGRVSNGVTKKLNYLVVGGLGSDEWKNGSFGTKIAKAIEYKRLGVPLLIIHEDAWACSL